MRSGRKTRLRCAWVVLFALGACGLSPAARAQKAGDTAGASSPGMASYLPAAQPYPDEDGYDLWLRYRPVADPELADHYRSILGAVAHSQDESPTLLAARSELTRGMSAMFGWPAPDSVRSALPATDPAESQGDRAVVAGRPGAQRLGGRSGQVPQESAGKMPILLGTPRSSSMIAALGLDQTLSDLGPEGYLVRNVPGAGVVIASQSDIGALYGSFAFLKHLQLGKRLEGLDFSDRPHVSLRVLNHWDNLDRTVERGYAGSSLWDWHRLPDYLPRRYTDYARANTSLGINGTVLTNVNSNALILTEAYLAKVKALADVFRPFGIRVYLTARFSAPIEIGGLATADPLDAEVASWWKAKTAEIYRWVPDFGGFLVKANSEGQPGPQDYGRSHADGANMLADAVAPFGGVVMWRAFVYSPDPSRDRAGQAYEEFQPLDGTFRKNVLIQVKNGPIDFQPREPFSPLFGAMPETPMMMEFQITKEYLGLTTHLAWLGKLYEEVLQADTYAKGPGSTVAKVVDGSLDGHTLSGMAGVSNIGTDRNWCGSHFDCANWYAFGRLAWNPGRDAESIAREWLRLTFSGDDNFVDKAARVMEVSREAAVDYRTPLGLHHIMARSHHYGPGPWVTGGRPDWTSLYYHQADSLGIGFDRSGTGSNSVAQYAPEVAEVFGDLSKVPDQFLLWFHHVPWDHPMRSGRILWDEMALHYQRGVETVREMQTAWSDLRQYVDVLRWQEVATFLEIQEREARWWRDACLLYFQTFSKRPLPPGVESPEHTLEYYMNLRHRFVPGIPDGG